jgi:hypothetical protein
MVATVTHGVGNAGMYVVCVCVCVLCYAADRVAPAPAPARVVCILPVLPRIIVSTSLPGF